MTNDDLKRFYPVNGNQDKPESFVRYDKDGNIPGGGSGGAQIEKLDLVVGDPEVIYDTTDGITITSQGQITQGGTTYNVDVEQNIPIIAGEGITIDASEDGKAIVVKKDKLYQHTIRFQYGTDTFIYFSFINTIEAEYLNIGQAIDALYNISPNKSIVATGKYKDANKQCMILAVTATANNKLGASTIVINPQTTIINDTTVIQDLGITTSTYTTILTNTSSGNFKDNVIEV